MPADPHHDDPAADGAARAAQLVAMTLSIAEGVARLRAERLAAQAMDDERQAAALRSQHRTEAAAAWLSDRTGPPPPAQTPPPAPDPFASKPANGPPNRPGGVRIVCSPRDLADQAFPVAMPDAMATAQQAAKDAVQARPALTAPRPQPQLTSRPGAVPSKGGGTR
jgi:hypothetical protein